MPIYSFQRVSDNQEFPIGGYDSDAMALALLSIRAGGGEFTLEGDGEPEFFMKKSLDGWGQPNIPVYRKTGA